jgi:hypothetical protein
MNYNAFRDALRRQTRRDLMHPQERCPDSKTLANYVTGELDEETQRHVGVHIALCKDCFQEMSLLENLEQAASRRSMIEKLKESVIDLGRTYGPGAILGSIRIMSEGPAFAARGGASPERIFKVVEMVVGENTYSIELAVTPDGSVSCDVTGYRTPREIPLKIVARAETGEELLAVETDKHGSAHFVLAKEELPEGSCVLIFTLASAENHLLFGVPERGLPP